jgi:ATP-dependent Zn protease
VVDFGAAILGAEDENLKTDPRLLEALAHCLLFPDRLIDYLTIEPREDSLGYLSIIPDETRHCRTKNELKYCIQIAHVGRLAELQSPQGKAHPDDVKNSGAPSDVDKASQY